MRTAGRWLITVGALTICGSHCASADGQEPPAQEAAAGEPATVDGCQIIARIDGQIVLACEIIWQVNRILESNPDIPPEQYATVRDQLMKRTLAGTLDTKLLYNEFRRSFPAENMPRLEESLLEPFEEKEVPRLIKALDVGSQRELEQELSRLGSSLADARRAFNEKVIASEWIRSKVKINEEINPEEMLSYYRQNASDFDYPAQVRWEELMVRKGRFNSPRQAFAEMAQLGNDAWPRTASNPDPAAPVFAELARTKSDGFNAKEGGQYDWTTKGALKDAVIDEALFGLPVGQLSKILESDAGFHIVRVLERKDAGRKPFTEVQNDIREKLKDERFRDAVDTYLAQLHRDARIWTIYTGPVSADVLLGRAPDGQQQR